MISNLLNTVGTIYRPDSASLAPSGSGEVRPAWPWPIVGNDVPSAMFSPRSNFIAQQDYGQIYPIDWDVFYELGTDVRNGDRYVVGPDIYELANVAVIYGHHIEAQLRRVVMP